MPVIAITGGIGSGKSTVRRMFEELGAFGIDADELAREVVLSGSEGARLLKETFGPGYFDSEGHLDRSKMAAKVFKDPNARLILESILHPLIRAAERQYLSNIQRETPDAVVVVEIPLLIEAGRSKEYNGVVLVKASTEVRIARCVDSGKYSRDEAVSRMASQATEKERENVANWTVDNGGDMNFTARQVKDVYNAVTRTITVE